MPFLTLEDPNAKIKGSRDPLGVQPAWTTFGRHVVRNLTTVSSSVRGFTVLLLARHLSAELVEANEIPKEEALDAFLRMEQICAYARFLGDGDHQDIRGIERVARFHEEGKGIVQIRTDPRGAILSDQKVYGLWGLYSVPARVSGLIPDGPLGVTPQAQAFLEEQYLCHLDGQRPALKKLIRKGGKLNTNPGLAWFNTLVKLLGPRFSDAEKDFYGHFLRDGREVKKDHADRQAIFRDILEGCTNLEQRVDRAEWASLISQAEQTDEALARRLNRIFHLETLLAPAEALFDFLLAHNRRRPQDLAAEVSDRWGNQVPQLDRKAFQELVPELGSATSPKQACLMDRCQAALHDGDYEAAIRALLEWNALVMRKRRAAPWIRLDDQGGQLEVRFLGMERLFPHRKDLGQLWRYSYFVDSLKAVTHQLRCQE